MRTLAATLALAPLFALPAAAEPGDIVAEVDSFQASFVVETVAEGLETPWGVAFLPDGRYLVTERPGRIRIVSADGALSAPLEHDRSVVAEGQGGMLGITLDPQFADNGLVYFIYSAGDGEVTWDEVARGRLAGDALEDVTVIWSADSRIASPGHYGGRLVWDRDGALFVTLGERMFQMAEAQTPSNHFGTVVRINSDGTIPEGNPFTGGEDGRADVWSYGHRNQQGAFVHPETGELWTSEHGARGGDELNVVRAGANHGWPLITYGINYNGQPISPDQELPGMVDPVWYWQPSIATSGLAYYDGDAFPKWKGDVFAGGLAGMLVQRLEINGTRVVGAEPLLADFGERIREIAAGPDGYLYLLTDNAEGRLLRIRPKT
jgi:glucose/arabinose dehydrogenase